MDQTTRVNLVQSLLTNNDSNLSISKASELMGISRSSVYYTPAPSSEEELECKRIIDVLHTDNPSWGSRQMSMQLKSRGFNVGRRKARRYMDEMAIDPIYPKKKKKKDMPESKIYPYLLRNANIIRPNQAWSIDITYIPMPKGYAYLTAIIDWYSRYLVEWELDETLALRPVVNAVKKAFKIAKPEIFNSDQGIQFRSPWYSYILSENNVKQSMDGRGRWADNIIIERWFRSLKHEEVYLTSYNNIREARIGIGKYIHTYNFESFHSALDGMTPAEAFYPIQLIEEAKNYY